MAMTGNDVILHALRIVGQRDAFNSLNGNQTPTNPTAAEIALLQPYLDALISKLSKDVQLWSAVVTASAPITAGVQTFDSSVLGNYQGDPVVNLMLNMLPVSPSASVGSGGANNLAASTAYFYVVNAFASASATQPLAVSPEITATTTSPNKTITVSWPAVAGASSYRVYRGTKSGLEVVYTSTSGTSIVDDGSLSYVAGSPYLGQQTPVKVISAAAWQSIQNKSAVSNPTAVFFDSNGIGWLNFVPAASGILTIEYRRVLSASGTLTNALDLPAEWQIDMGWGLAYEAMNEFVLTADAKNEIRAEWARRKAERAGENVQDGTIEFTADDSPPNTVNPWPFN